MTAQVLAEGAHTYAATTKSVSGGCASVGGGCSSVGGSVSGGCKGVSTSVGGCAQVLVMTSGVGGGCSLCWRRYISVGGCA